MPEQYQQLARGKGSLHCEAGTVTANGAVRQLPVCDRRARWIVPGGAVLCGACKRAVERAGG